MLLLSLLNELLKIVLGFLTTWRGRSFLVLPHKPGGAIGDDAAIETLGLAVEKVVECLRAIGRVPFDEE